MKLICIKNNSDVRNFTDRAVYRAVSAEGNLVGILDDLGRLRLVLPGEPSPHLVRQLPGRRYLNSQEVVGRFEILP
jgi:hypothetical protein